MSRKADGVHVHPIAFLPFARSATWFAVLVSDRHVVARLHRGRTLPGTAIVSGNIRIQSDMSDRRDAWVSVDEAFYPAADLVSVERPLALMVFIPLPRVIFSLPPTYMLDSGKQTAEFFQVHTDEYNRKGYRLKSLEQYSKEHNVQEQPSKKYFQATTLPEIVKTYPMSRKSGKAADVQKGAWCTGCG